MLKGKKIWITGASRGIGAAIALGLRDSEAKLILSSTTQKTMRNIMPTFAKVPDVFFLPFDIAKPGEAERMYQKIALTMGGVDILINNAGIGLFKPLNDFTDEEVERQMNINFYGPYYCIKAVLPRMLKRERGMIVNVSSVVTRKSFPGSSVYGASKAALMAMTRSLREEVRHQGIKVIDVIPGATDTDIWADKVREKHGDKMMKPEDVAAIMIDVIKQGTCDRMMPEEIVLAPQHGDL